MKKAFTLSEVLITLSIVGVVAVLTIPGVVKNYKNRLYVSQLQKVSSQIENATQAIMNDEHTDNFLETSFTLDNGIEYFLKNYFKTSKTNCGTGTNLCVASIYTTIKGLNAGIISGYCIQTKNGAALCMTYNATSHVSTILIDVNGAAEPNIAGRDAFVVNIKEDGSIYDPKESYDCNTSSTAYSGLKYAGGCYKSIVDAGWKMNY